MRKVVERRLEISELPQEGRFSWRIQTTAAPPKRVSDLLTNNGGAVMPKGHGVSEATKDAIWELRAQGLALTSMRIESVEAYMPIALEVRSKIAAKAFDDAVLLAESCEGDESLCAQLLGYTYSEAGAGSGDRDLLEAGVKIWTALQEEGFVPSFAFNQANSEQALFDVAVPEQGHALALQEEREHLHTARALFGAVAAAEDADDGLRVQASTNLGNTYDHLGRDIDALESYARALAIDPEFGMALGNKGIGLLGIAPLAAVHAPRVLGDAAEALDRALEDEERILEIGGASALEHFQEARAHIKTKDDSAPAAHFHRNERWNDPFRQWCRDHGLYLHVSQDCLVDEGGMLDPLFFSRVFMGLTDEEQARHNNLVDAFNTIKRDFIAARYLVWLVSGSESPIRKEAAELSSQAKYWDSLTYAKWGVRTGLGATAFTAAVNVLDKVASLVHLYFETGRVKDVYFSTLWHKRGKNEMDPEILVEINAGNRGLLALCDLSCDLEQPTPLNQLVAHRHAATHRFLVAHEMLMDDERISAGTWLDRIEWRELVDDLATQLRIARAAIIYLTRTIEIREGRQGRELEAEGEAAPTFPATEAFTEHAEFD